MRLLELKIILMLNESKFPEQTPGCSPADLTSLRNLVVSAVLGVASPTQ